MTNEMLKIIREIKFNFTKDEIIRFLYVKLAPCFKRDLSYFLASEEEQKRQFAEGFTSQIPNVVCKVLVEFYQNLYQKYHINSKILTCNTKGAIPLYILAVEGDFGWYYLDPLNDLFRNQYGLKPVYFGIKPTFKNINKGKIEFTKLSDDYLYFLDKSLKLYELDMYLDTFIEEIHKSFAVRSKAIKYFNSSKNADLIEKKLAFYNDNLINLGNVNCLYERMRLYTYLNSRLLDRKERKLINVKLEGEITAPNLIINYEDKLYLEEQHNKTYVLKRIR